MRGDDQQSGHLFSYLSPEQRVPADHPLRVIRQMTDEALRELSPQFEAIYATTGRPSVPPEQLLRALLLQALYTVRSERLLVEQLEYNLLFRWFVGLAMDDIVWTPTTFSKNRERLLAGDIARQFFEAVLTQARVRRVLSDEHFTVDGTLLEAWARWHQPRPVGRRPEQSDGEFSWGAPLEYDAPLHHRSRQSVGEEGPRERSEAGLRGRSADGESPRLGRRCVCRHREWYR
jgi:transposase